MSIQLYKPTAKMTGMAVSFHLRTTGNIYINFLKQATWNDKTKKGSFIENRNKPGFSTIIKFNQIEAASMLDAIERFYTFEPFHSSAKTTSRITFGPAEGANPSTFILKVLQTDKQDTTKKSSFLFRFRLARLV